VLEEAEEGHASPTLKAKIPTSEVEEAFQMAQQVDVAQALAAMGNAITGLTQAINQIIAGPPQQHNVLVSTTGAIVGAGVEKPAKFKGKKDDIQKNAEDARRFLAAYKAYTCLQPALNMVDALGVITRKDSQWIGSFLSFMEGEAGDWATPYREEMGNGTTPFNGRWDDAVNAFQECFLVISVEESARTQLRKVRQGKGTAAQYHSRFEQYKNKCGYNDGTLQEFYYAGLNKSFKQHLTNSTTDTTSLPQLKSVVAQLDLKQQEYDRHRRSKRNKRPTQRVQTYLVVDVPMEIDAARVNAARNGSNKTRSNWLAAMRGRCFNCAGTTHLARDKDRCPTNGKNCGYCGGFGHFKLGCQDKFLSLERMRRVTPQMRQMQLQWQQQCLQAPRTLWQPQQAQLLPLAQGIRSATVEEVPEEEQRAQTMDSIVSQMAALQAQLVAMQQQGF
jgi:hypothetical protein